MIHFLGKTYLEYAETKPQINHFWAKPTQYLRIVDRGLAGIVDRDSVDEHIMDFKSVEEAVEKFVSFDNFLSFLNEKEKEDRVFIYCDEFAMVKMLSSAWKSIFPNLDLDTAYSFYISYKDSEQFKKESGEEYIDIGVDSGRLHKENFLSRYWNFTKEEFKEYFESAPVLNLKGKEYLIGMEFVFTKFLLKSDSYQSILKPKMEYLYKKNLCKEILLMSSMIKEYAVLLLTKKGLLEQTVLNDKSVVDYLKGQKRYEILFDSKANHSADTYLHLKTNYNLLKVISDLYTDCSIIHKEINPEFVSIEELKQECPISMYILDKKKEPSMEELMTDDILNFTTYNFFKNHVNTGLMNHFLLQSIYIANKTDPSLLNALR